jgi:hypothetical protein
MKTNVTLLLLVVLLGCKTANAPVPLARDVSSITNELALVLSLARQNAKPVLTDAVRTQTEAFAQLRRLYPETKFSEFCEHDGWFVFSDTPLDSPPRFHGGYAVEKNGRRVGGFGLW